MSTRIDGEVSTPATSFQFSVHSVPVNGNGPQWIPPDEVGFTSVDGLTAETEAIDHKDGNDLYGKKLPGRTMAPEVVLSRGVDRYSRLDAWLMAVQERTALAHGRVLNHVYITLWERQGVEGVAEVPARMIKQWKLTKAWPSKVETGTLDAGSGEVLIERLTLQSEGPPQVVFPSANPANV